MPTRAEYRNAAEEHLGGGIACHLSGSYLSAHYLFGHAVECILRAYGATEDRTHDLRREFASSTYELVLPVGRKEALVGAFEEVALRWRSPDRFEDATSLIRRLNRIGATKNVKGDKLKTHSARMSEAAATVVELGLERWTPR